MSKKNSSVILKNSFKDYKDLSVVYFNFEKKLNFYKKYPCVVAVSGGADSLALVALSKAFNLKKKLKFYYVLVNHNIRNKSSEEAKSVKTLLRKNDIRLEVLTNKSKIKTNIQSKAREIRYKMLTDYCNKKKAKILITAHNLEDQVETFFIRLSRGSGLTGLSGMKLVSNLGGGIKLLRPLLNVKKKYLISITKKIFGKYFYDPSNKNRKYLRTKVRGLKKPLKQSGINYDQIIKSINNLAASRSTLDEYYLNISKEIIKKNKNQICINLKKFQNLNDELKIRVINDSIKILKNNYYNPRSKKVLNLIKNLESEKLRILTLGGCLFSIRKQILYVKIEKR